MANIQKQNRKPVNKGGLHVFIATGGKPKDYEGCTATSKTVPNYKKGSGKNK